MGIFQRKPNDEQTPFVAKKYLPHRGGVFVVAWVAGLCGGRSTAIDPTRGAFW